MSDRDYDKRFGKEKEIGSDLLSYGTEFRKRVNQLSL